MSITADSDTGKQLEQIIREKVSTFGLDDDLDDVAQYIVVMICNNKPINELTTELCGIFGDKFTDEFGQWAYSEMEKLKQQPKSAFGVPVQQQQQESSSQSGDGFGGYVDTSSETTNIPRGPASMLRKQQNNNGVSKSSNRRQLGGHSIGGGGNNNQRNRNQGNLEAQLQQDVMMGGDDSRGDGNNLDLSSGGNGQQQRRERCRHWPNCSYPNCKFPHPTKPCNSYPNCSYPKGTCPFLHIGEDPLPGGNGAFVPPGQVDPKNPLGGGWMNGVPVPPQMMMAAAFGGGHMNNGKGGGRKQGFNKNNRQQQPQEPTLQICKYSDKCANQQCPFGHPTPANAEGKVRVYEWCPKDTECDDPTCEYAHKSGSLVRAPEPIPDRVLETCKYMDACTNPKCRYRHPRSPIHCRNGPDCERLDCLFTHPYKEDCKFGINCKNIKCLFQHPAERDAILKKGGPRHTWVNPGSENNNESGSATSERQFASEDADKMVISSEAA